MAYANNPGGNRRGERQLIGRYLLPIHIQSESINVAA
jgi:hypothetical protein